MLDFKFVPESFNNSAETPNNSLVKDLKNIGTGLFICYTVYKVTTKLLSLDNTLKEGDVLNDCSPTTRKLSSKL